VVLLVIIIIEFRIYIQNTKLIWLEVCAIVLLALLFILRLIIVVMQYREKKNSMNEYIELQQQEESTTSTTLAKNMFSFAPKIAPLK
jgi:Ca2+/Na+ antiporter